MTADKHRHPQYSLRIPPTVMNKLKYIAEYNGRSANKETEQIILRHIAAYESQHGVIRMEGFTPRTRSKEATP
ncbi:MAG: Arc family DNA-binding protein [Oscillospiraceae bacterium]|nr:Arc family DNA-binding protein [Oscillospiraceae bacterium]